MAIILFLLYNIIGDCMVVSFLVYTVNDHRYPELDSQSSKDLIPDFYDFSGRYCFLERQLFHEVRDTSTEMFCEGM
jgi:hypothetical protein